MFNGNWQELLNNTLDVMNLWFQVAWTCISHVYFVFEFFVTSQSTRMCISWHITYKPGLDVGNQITITIFSSGDWPIEIIILLKLFLGRRCLCAHQCIRHLPVSLKIHVFIHILHHVYNVCFVEIWYFLEHLEPWVLNVAMCFTIWFTFNLLWY